jgi:DNA-binding response OmpR family regulator
MSAKPIILVVDDDPPILVLMRTLLREFGFEPVTASSGEQALVEAREHRPSVILIDKNMPGMTGDDAIRALRGQPALDRLLILILSGQPVSAAELAELGADGAVLKPFDLEDLIGRLRSLTHDEQGD